MDHDTRERIKILNEKGILDISGAGFHTPTEFAADPGKFPVGRKSTMDRSALQLRYTQTTEGLDFARLNEVLELAFGGRKRDTEATRETFTNSPYTSFAFDGEKLVACARAESDGVLSILRGSPTTTTSTFSCCR